MPASHRNQQGHRYTTYWDCLYEGYGVFPPMKPEPKRHPRWPRSGWVWIGYWVSLFVVMHVPVEGGGPTLVPHGDKIIHFGLYYLLARLGGRHQLAARRRQRAAGFSLRGHPRGLKPAAHCLLWAVVYAAYAALDEWLQPFVGRTMSLGDWIADLIGISLATLTIALQRRSAEPTEHEGTAQRQT